MARTAGLLLGALLIGYAVMLGISLGTGAGVPMTTWVAPDKHKPATTGVEADTGLQQKSPIAPVGSSGAVTPGAPRPSTSGPAKPSATGSATPGVTVAPATTVVPSATPTHGHKPTAPPGKKKKTG
jgi:hypothetical protein